jgi:excisionase family DNA binding protein
MTREPYLSKTESAEYLGVSTKTIRRLIASGALPAYRVGPRNIRIKASDLEALARPIPTASAS